MKICQEENGQKGNKSLSDSKKKMVKKKLSKRQP